MTTDPHSETLKIAHNADCEYCSSLEKNMSLAEELATKHLGLVGLNYNRTVAAIDEAIERCAQEADKELSTSCVRDETRQRTAQRIRALKSKT